MNDNSDPRVDALTNAAILTDTQVRITMAPVRQESRVVALQKSLRATEVERIASLTQQGKVHVQIKAGFAPERHLVLEPAEVAILYDMLDRFIQELPRVDKAAGT